MNERRNFGDCLAALLVVFCRWDVGRSFEAHVFLMRLISQIDRDRIGGQLTRWLKALESTAWARMTHEEAYDAVYRTTMHPDHKQAKLKEIARITGG